MMGHARVRRISAYLAVRNAFAVGTSLDDFARTWLELCSELVVVDVGSDDGSWEAWLELARVEPRLRLIRQTNPSLEAGLALAREACRSEYCLELSTIALPEVDDFVQLQELCRCVELSPRALDVPYVLPRAQRAQLSRNDPALERGPNGLRDRVTGEEVPSVDPETISLSV